MPTTEIVIINNKPDIFTIRSKLIYANMSQNTTPRSGFHKSAGSGSQSLNTSNSQSSLNSQNINHN